MEPEESDPGDEEAIPAIAETTDNHAPSPYTSQISSSSGLVLLQEQRIKSAVDNRGPFGLFSLFVPFATLERIRLCTNASQQLGTAITSREMSTFFGLFSAMSLIRLRQIKHYWSTKMFLGQSDFKALMSRNRFEAIRGAIRLVLTENVTPQLRGEDPLWHSRALIQELNRNCISLAAPRCVFAIDEATLATKARTRAKSYIPSKPDKFGIRFYTVVEWRSLYVLSVWDNGRGNLSQKSEVDRFLEVFPEMRAHARQVSCTGSNCSARALWAVMIALQSKRIRAENGRRIVFCDNYYTSVDLGVRILRMTDGETRMCGTIRLSYLDAENRENVKEALRRLENDNRHAFYVVQTKWMDTGGPITGRRRRGSNEVPRISSVLQNSGFIIWIDRKPVCFYTNDLQGTPSQMLLRGETEEAKNLVHGMVPIQRWMGDEQMHRTVVSVPAVVSGYNLFMNSVDRMDQLRAGAPTRRRESRVHMSLLSWIFDIGVNNGFAIYNELRIANSTLERLTMDDFKQKVVSGFIHEQPADIIPVTPSPNIKNHFLLKSKSRVRCFVCYARGKNVKVAMVCVHCQRGFHLSCFAAYHHRDAFQSRPDVSEALKQVDVHQRDKARTKVSAQCPTPA